MKFIRNIFILAAMVFMLSACSLIGGKESIDPPQDVSYEEDLDVTKDDGAETEKEGKVKTELYLIDKDGYVVPQTFELPNTESVAKQALDHLVKDGPITDQLPNDFRAVLPAGTETSVDIKDGVATVNFSNEFTEYAPEDELKILQSVTWTLTQFDSIEKVNLKLNGKQLKEMPVNGTPINGELTRKNGINIETNVADITNTYPVTVYYLAQSNEKSYYVPVTKRVSNKVDNPVMAVVNELIKGPNTSSTLYTLFMPDVQLVDEPKLDNGIVKLNFNENIYGSYDQKLVSKQVLEPLVLSLTEQEGVEGVSIQVNGDTNVVNQDGQTLSEPVTRPASVNTSSY
ncbi:GerMN domain-containing protein [Bacillus andreraoultii]|uniref:GerMN domain-containing protein n=1 Tax=Bacillus andreraoultii TaxID=1499685 RepID=UPI00053B618D|nr:GerMN domain-containing protein [Bacillus andreraoultii]